MVALAALVVEEKGDTGAVGGPVVALFVHRVGQPGLHRQVSQHGAELEVVEVHLEADERVQRLRVVQRRANHLCDHKARPSQA